MPASIVAAVERSIWRQRPGRLGEMEVRVGQAGDRHLIGGEGDPSGERVGPCLELHLRAGERDPTIADPDRLDPPEAGPSRPASRSGR